MGTVRFPDNVTITGRLIAGQFDMPASAVSDTSVEAGANIDADKLEHTHRKTYFKAGTAATETIPIHSVIGATARRLQVVAGSIAIAIGNATVTIDVKKNGTSVMTGATPVTLDSSNTARVAEALSIATTTAVAGDLFELVVVATIGTGTLPTGLFVEFQIDEVAG